MVASCLDVFTSFGEQKGGDGDEATLSREEKGVLSQVLLFYFLFFLICLLEKEKGGQIIRTGNATLFDKTTTYYFFFFSLFSQPVWCVHYYLLQRRRRAGRLARVGDGRPIGKAGAFVWMMDPKVTRGRSSLRSRAVWYLGTDRLQVASLWLALRAELDRAGNSRTLLRCHSFFVWKNWP